MRFSLIAITVVSLLAADAFVPQSTACVRHASLPDAGRMSNDAANRASKVPLYSYLDSLQEACDEDQPTEDCAPAMANYLDALSTGEAQPTEEAGAGIASYLDSVAGSKSDPSKSAEPAAVAGYLDAVSSGTVAPPAATAVKSYLDDIAMGNALPREAFPTNMANEFARARLSTGTVGYESRKPYTYQRYQQGDRGGLKQKLAIAEEICDADSSSQECANAIAAYEDARAAYPTSMVNDLSRGRPTSENLITTVGYESRKPYTYQDVMEVCDADSSSPECASAIAAYEDARAAYPTSMDNDISRAKSNAGTVGYESRKPYYYHPYQKQTWQEKLAIAEEVCDVVSNSQECANAIAAYEDARASWPTTMGEEFSRARSTSSSNVGTVGYESRLPYVYQQAMEVCDADASSPECDSAIAAYEDARAAYPTSMNNDLSRGLSSAGNVGYESRKPYTYHGAASWTGTSNVESPKATATRPSSDGSASAPDAPPQAAPATVSYLDAIDEACEPAATGTAPTDECAEAITGYLDALGAGVAQPSREAGAGIASYLDTIASSSGPSVATSGEAIAGYLDTIALGAVTPPSAPAVKSYLEDISAGEVSAPTSSSSIAGYLDTLGSSTSSSATGGKAPTRVNSFVQASGPSTSSGSGYAVKSQAAITPYKDSGGATPMPDDYYMDAVHEFCDADAGSAACAEAIAAYKEARAAYPTNMVNEFSRARSSAGNVGYESRKPYTYQPYQEAALREKLAAAEEVCDADTSSQECANAIAAYEDARASWPTTMGKEFSRARSTSATNVGTIGYESRLPYVYQQAMEVCDADASSQECANAIAAYEDARAAYPTSMNNDLSRAKSNTGNVGYESRKPYTYQPYQEAAGPSAPPSYLDAINEACDENQPIEVCAPVMANYLDALSTGAAEPSLEAGAGIASYLDSVAGSKADPSSSAEPAAVAGYLDALATGTVAPPAAIEIKSFLDEIASGSILPRESFPTNMAHEFARAISSVGNVGYESRKPYTYQRYWK